jgi:hypothetical protein
MTSSQGLINVKVPAPSSFGSGSGDRIKSASKKKKGASNKKKEHHAPSSSSSASSRSGSPVPKVRAANNRMIYGAPTDMSSVLQTYLKPEIQVDQKRLRYEKTLIHGEEHIDIFLSEITEFAIKNKIEIASNTSKREYSSFPLKDSAGAMRDQVSYSFILQKRNLAVRLTIRDAHDFKMSDERTMENLVSLERNIEIEWSCFPIFTTLMGDRRKLKYSAPQLQEPWESELWNRQRRATHMRSLAKMVISLNMISWLAFVISYKKKEHNAVAQDMALLRFNPSKVTKENICADPDPSDSEHFRDPRSFDSQITSV